MNPRIGLYVVAVIAVVLSFAGLYTLAIACSFIWWLAILVPVLIDAGAATASIVWLGGDHPDRARQFARAQTLTLLAVSVLGNALSHALDAYALRPHWGVVVLVGSLAPATLASTMHLLSLVAREKREPEVEMVVEPIPSDIPPHPIALPESPDHLPEPPDPREEAARELVASGAGRTRLVKELGLSEYEARQIVSASRRNGKVVA